MVELKIKIITQKMEKSDSNKRLWEINEKFTDKKELDEQLKSIEIEKEQLKIEAESIKNKKSKTLGTK